MYYPDNPKLQDVCRGSEFCRDIKKNLYLTTPTARKGTKEYLDIKLGRTNFGEDENNSGYQKCLENITYVVEETYKTIVENLDKLEKNLLT